MKDMKEGEKIILDFNKDSLRVKTHNKKALKIGGEGFARAILSVWFKNPGDKGLMNGLLGK